MGFDLLTALSPFVVIGLLGLVLRWIFKSSRPHTGRPVTGTNANLGLLVPVLGGVSRMQALEGKDRLSAQNIRCSLSRRDRDSYDLMVFAADLIAATRLLKG
jgi:hypothetical protein